MAENKISLQNPHPRWKLECQCGAKYTFGCKRQDRSAGVELVCGRCKTRLTILIERP